MKKLIFLLVLFAGSIQNLNAGVVACFDEKGVLTKSSLSSEPVPGCEYYDVGNGINQAQDDAIRLVIKNVPQRYIKKLNGFPVEMSPAEKTSVDDAWAAQIQADNLAASRSGAKDSVDGLSPEGVRLRAAMLVVLDETNNLRQWIESFKAQVASASSLADLKTRVASLPSTPDRTAAQLKTAIKKKIDAGSAD